MSTLPRSYATLSAIHDFSAGVLGADGLVAAAQSALKRFVVSGFARRAFIRFARSEGGTFELMVTRNPAEAQTYQVKGIASIVVSRMETWQEEIFLPDVRSDEAIAAEASTYEVELGTLMCLPLGPGGSQGGLYFDRGADEARYDELDLRLARHYALVLGNACLNFDRQEASHEKQEHLESLLGILRTVSGIMELPTLMDHITQKALAITDAERAFVLLVEGLDLTYGAGRDREGSLPATHFKRISHSVCQQVLTGGQEVCVFDAGDSEFAARQSVVSLQLQGIVAVPLMGRDGPVGILYVDSRTRNLDRLKKEMKVLRALGSVASLMVENARMYQRVTVDPKTGLFTRALLTVRLEEEITRAKRYVRPCSLLLIEIDGWAAIAREHGADKADVALRVACQVVRAQARGGIDFPARFADDRLALVLPETEGQGAFVLAERIREKIGKASFAGASGTPTSFTVSIGGAVWRAPNGSGLELVQEAEAALFGARQAGGDHTLCAGQRGGRP